MILKFATKTWSLKQSTPPSTQYKYVRQRNKRILGPLINKIQSKDMTLIMEKVQCRYKLQQMSNFDDVLVK